MRGCTGHHSIQSFLEHLLGCSCTADCRHRPHTPKARYRQRPPLGMSFLGQLQLIFKALQVQGSVDSIGNLLTCRLA